MNKVLVDREVVKKLKARVELGGPEWERSDLIAALSAALKQPGVELVVAYAWYYDSCGGAVKNRLAITETQEPTIFLKNVFARGPFPITAPQPAQQAEVTFTDDDVKYIARFGSRCRDCADENGVCPNSGLPCADAPKAIRHVLYALSYGLNNGYLPSRAIQPPAALQPAQQAVSWTSDDVEALRHASNEWADMAVNGFLWVRNIVEGVSKPADALENLRVNLKHCREVNSHPGVQRIVCGTRTAAPQPAQQPGGAS